MISFPNCKINLGLRILEKRPDGFHNLETVFYPLPVHDILEVIQQPANEQELAFTQSGLTVAGSVSDNLCLKAWQLLKNDFPQLPASRLHLHKLIPMGAGLGGGSADGAFTLRLLNDKYQLGISQEQLLDYAAQLGSDAAFFIINRPCHATGRGELLAPVALDLSAYYFLLVNPGIHVNTGWAFSQLTPAVPATTVAAIIAQPVVSWKEKLINDFEAPVGREYPVIAGIKNDLYAAGAVYAAMSGSGSTVFGIFENKPAGHLFAGSGYFVKSVRGRKDI
ncbi:MAG: 4-(cytidine 5'-diphospho)-2-C-methyl-D-erythritol kinase [Ferruginibacter sp.]